MRPYLNIKIIILLFLSFLFGANLNAQEQTVKLLEDSLTLLSKKYASVGNIKIKKIVPNDRDRKLTLSTNDAISYLPLRPDNVDEIYDMVKRIIKYDYPNYSVQIFSDGREISELIPGYYRKSGKSPYRRFVVSTDVPLVTNHSVPYKITEGLDGRHLAVWQSHGRFYNQAKDEWLWQRPVLFQTVEDLLPQSYVLPFLVPMLENAGANVLLPRERDTQLYEIIVDNDVNFGKSTLATNEEWQKKFPGFANPYREYGNGENPFYMGSYLQADVTTHKKQASVIKWIPEIKETGYYAVYVSYKSFPNSTKDAHYTIYHLGGKTEFTVNQTMGGGTWIYLGKFKFGKSLGEQCRVELSNYSKHSHKIITADAVKIGGGWGNIARKHRKSKSSDKGKTSHMPRFTEGARYWLQWAGVPDSVYSRTEGKNDYSDDFQSRGYWVNYLAGGSSVLPRQEGLHIPLDMAFAMHTDAGLNKNDSIIGTLAIYTVKNSDKKTTYKNGISRWNARELTDIVQSQVVNDIRLTMNPNWNRRGLWNRNYSESRVGEVPTMLLEALSHQNFRDMQFALDPRFRFVFSRAVYKGMLRYISTVNDLDYAVQPLPVKHFSSKFSVDSASVILQWEDTYDPLEPTAKPTSYIVYTRENDGGFDNGEPVKSKTFTKKIKPNIIYSFKVEALNRGGKSFPSEILSVCRVPNGKPTVLIVNGFTRISAPQSFKQDSTFAGFNDSYDAGVPYISDISYVGSQQEFRRNIPYLNNQSPGFGASNENFAHKEIAGNTFDYPFVHGKSIKKAGYSFVSTSKAAILDNTVAMSDYKIVDLILGKERSIVNPFDSTKTEFRTIEPKMRKAITQLTESGGNILITGAHIVSDLVLSKKSTNYDKMFVENVLKVKWKTDKINDVSKVDFVTSYFSMSPNYSINFYHYPNTESYFVEAPDVIIPIDMGAIKICSYRESGLSAGVAYKKGYGVCTLGFPFETIEKEEQRDMLMKNILTFFQNKKIFLK